MLSPLCSFIISKNLKPVSNELQNEGIAGKNCKKSIFIIMGRNGMELSEKNLRSTYRGHGRLVRRFSPG